MTKIKLYEGQWVLLWVYKPVEVEAACGVTIEVPLLDWHSPESLGSLGYPVVYKGVDPDCNREYWEVYLETDGETVAAVWDWKGKHTYGVVSQTAPDNSGVDWTNSDKLDKWLNS